MMVVKNQRRNKKHEKQLWDLYEKLCGTIAEHSLKIGLRWTPDMKEAARLKTIYEAWVTNTVYSNIMDYKVSLKNRGLADHRKPGEWETDWQNAIKEFEENAPILIKTLNDLEEL